MRECIYCRREVSPETAAPNMPQGMAAHQLCRKTAATWRRRALEDGKGTVQVRYSMSAVL